MINILLPNISISKIILNIKQYLSQLLWTNNGSVNIINFDLNAAFQHLGYKIKVISALRRKKSSLFPLTSPKKLGTVSRHNFFPLINRFFFFQRKLLSFILQTC